MALSSELQAYLMRFKRLSQIEAQAWLDEVIPNWRDKSPAQPSGVIYHNGESGEANGQED